MSYRDARDADQARIAALEADLEAARRTIYALKGRPSQAQREARRSRGSSLRGERGEDSATDLVLLATIATRDHRAR